MRRSIAPGTAVLAAMSSLALSGCVVVGSSDSDSDSNGFGLLFLLVPVVLLFGVFRLFRPRRGNRSRSFAGYGGDDDDAPQPSVNMLRAELSVLADDAMRLEPQVTLKPEAADDFEAALHRYKVAQAALDDTEAAVDLVRVQRVVDEARWSMARASAILDGRPLPAPPPALQNQGRHGEPAVTVDRRNRPRYVDSPASFQSGWFAFGPGLFGGLLLGSMFGGDWFGGDGSDADGGDYGEAGGGDFGGNDFGGGDFGGGDFGGGDFG